MHIRRCMMRCERASHLCLDDVHCDRYRKASQQDQVEQVFGFAAPTPAADATATAGEGATTAAEWFQT